MKECSICKVEASPPLDQTIFGRQCVVCTECNKLLGMLFYLRKKDKSSYSAMLKRMSQISLKLRAHEMYSKLKEMIIVTGGPPKLTGGEKRDGVETRGDTP